MHVFQAGGELGPSRLLLYPDERGQVVFQIFRLCSSSSGGSLESTTSRVLTFTRVVKSIG